MTNITHSYDVIVIGAGAIGASTAYHFAKSGVRVLVLEKARSGVASERSDLRLLVCA